MIKAIYFDLDNTLVDRNASIDKFAHHFVDVFSADLQESCPVLVSSIVKEQDNGGYLPSDSKYSKIFQAIGCELSIQLDWVNSQRPEKLSEFWKTAFSKCTVEMKGAADLVEYLHQQKYHLGVISNGAEKSRLSTIEATSFGHLFSQVVSSEKFGISKPEPSIFKCTASQANFEAHECIYIGDHPIKDVLGASRAGLRAVWLKGFHDEIDFPQDTVIVNNLDAVREALSL
ncbi:HAD family hydrolase [Vibrio neptunius]|uniref:HAD family hydrolase n=1 Tax=Vibrio neptunius TaxID=170651 RepID=UPI00331456B8